MPHLLGLPLPEALSPQQVPADLCLLRRHSNVHRQIRLSLLWGSLLLFLGPVAHKVLFAPSESFWQVWGLILKEIVSQIQSCCSFSLALGCGVSSFGGIQHSPVNGWSAASCCFGVLAGEDERTSFYRTISSYLQYPCLENPMNSMKRKKDMTLKDELPRLVGATICYWRRVEK